VISYFSSSHVPGALLRSLLASSSLHHMHQSTHQPHQPPPSVRAFTILHRLDAFVDMLSRVAAVDGLATRTYALRHECAAVRSTSDLTSSILIAIFMSSATRVAETAYSRYLHVNRCVESPVEQEWRPLRLPRSSNRVAHPLQAPRKHGYSCIVHLSWTWLVPD
jgi:hypothetical protein